MTDKILTEAFDKLKAIEESDDPFCIGATKEDEVTEAYTEVVDEVAEEITEASDVKTVELVYKAMDNWMDTIEGMYGRIDDGLLGRKMEELGLTGEREGLKQTLLATLNEFEDFMPGLEMEYRGDDMGFPLGEASQEELDDMQAKQQKQSGDLAGLKDKLDQIKAQQGQRGYDDRSTRTAPFAKRRN